ncbi:NKPD1 [Branchiostoma lanceolatum]|uniref:NKPD1 protein n=1 Tax=Branchiostoma lanceolatum TaxID=7740 RepID=A0A8J9ZJ76_BRALA|nr:NKPD1 [Branchiostoma lanceolatum]
MIDLDGVRPLGADETPDLDEIMKWTRRRIQCYRHPKRETSIRIPGTAAKPPSSGGELPLPEVGEEKTSTKDEITEIGGEDEPLLPTQTTNNADVCTASLRGDKDTESSSGTAAESPSSDGEDEPQPEVREVGEEKSNMEDVIIEIESSNQTTNKAEVRTAASRGDTETESIPPTDASESDNDNSLHTAALRGEIKTVEELLKAGHDDDVNKKKTIRLFPDPIDKDMREAEFETTPLHCAVIGGDAKIVNRLLQVGADPGMRTKDLKSPVHIAIWFGRGEILDSLLLEIERKYLEEMKEKGTTIRFSPSPAQLLNTVDRNIRADLKLMVWVAAQVDNTGILYLLEEKLQWTEEDFAFTHLELNGNDVLKGDTLLHIAVQAESKNFALALMDLNPGLAGEKDRNGKTALDRADAELKQALAESLEKSKRSISLKSDSHFGEDSLGYQVYAQTIANIITDESATMPITVGIYARWGKGKSFVLNQIKVAINENIDKRKKLHQSNEQSKAEETTPNVPENNRHRVQETTGTSGFFRSGNNSRRNLAKKATICVSCLALLLFFGTVVGGILSHVYCPAIFAIVLSVGTIFSICICTIAAFLARRILLKAFPLLFWISRKQNLKLIGQWLDLLKLDLPDSPNRKTNIKKDPNTPDSDKKADTTNPQIEVIHVEFNAWLYSGCSVLWAGIVTKLCEKVEEKIGPGTTRLYRAIHDKINHPQAWQGRPPLLDRLWVRLLIAAILGIVLIVLAVQLGVNGGSPSVIALEILSGILLSVGFLTHAKQIWSFLKKMVMSQRDQLMAQMEKPNFDEELGFMAKVKKEVEVETGLLRYFEKVWKKQYRVVIVVDDLDRCPTDRVTKVIEAVSILLSDRDSPFISILAVDPRIVVKSIEASYGDMMKDGDINGYEYLKKIVQLPICLPHPGEEGRKRCLRHIVKASREKKFLAKLPKREEGAQLREGLCGLSYSWREDNTSEKSVANTAIGQLGNDDDDMNLFLMKAIESLPRDEVIRYVSGNPRQMRRIFNILWVSVGLLSQRENREKFTHEKFSRWMLLVEQWPYRMSWIIQYVEDLDQKRELERERRGASEEDILRQNVEEEESRKHKLQDIFVYEVKMEISTHDEWSKLSQLDDDPEMFELFLKETSFTVKDMQDLLPYTVNLDHSIQETIGQARAKTDIEGLEAPVMNYVLKKAMKKCYEIKLANFKPQSGEDNFSLSFSKIFTELELTAEKGEKVILSSTDDLFNSDVTGQSTAPRCILIEGIAGAGKTMFVSKEALDAVSQKTELGRRHDIVLLIRLREVREGDTIEKMVWDQCATKTTEGIDVRSIRRVLQRHNPKRVLFLLDGYDELRPEARAAGQSIPELLDGMLYPYSTIMITSRPSAGVQQYTQPDCHVRIEGFSPAHVQKYVRQYFSLTGNPGLAEKLIANTKSSQVVTDLMHTPLFLTAVCLMWEEDQEMVSTGIAELYSNLLTCLVRKHCRREGVDMPPNGLPDALLHFGKLALEALLRNETLLKLTDVKEQEGNWELLQKFGVVYLEKSASKWNSEEQLKFSHRMMQEFLAGRYVAHALVKEKKGIDELLQLTSISRALELSNLLQFTCGCESRAAQAVMEELRKLSSKEFAKMHKLQAEHFEEKSHVSTDANVRKPCETYKRFVKLCLNILNERQEPEVLQTFSQALPIVILDGSVNSREGAALKYYIQNLKSVKLPDRLTIRIGEDTNSRDTVQYLGECFTTSFPELKLDLKLSGKFDSNDLTARLDSVLKKVSVLRSLRLPGTGLTPSSLQPLVQGFRHMSLLEELDLSDNPTLGDAGMEVLQDGMKVLEDGLFSVPHLAVLSLKRVGMTSTGMKSLAPNMRHLAELRELDISENEIGDAGVEVLKDGLSCVPHLAVLRLKRVGMTSEGMKYLAPNMRHLAELRELDISENQIGNAALESLTTILLKFTAMQELGLSRTGISATGIRKLIPALRHLTGLIKLDISGNRIGDTGLESLITILHNFTAMQELDLSWTGISATGMSKLVPALRHLTRLIKLDINWNDDIGDPGLEFLAAILHHLTAMKVLVLRKIGISDRGISALIKALPRLVQLQVLDVSHNNIGDSGIVSLVQTLCQPSSLDMELNPPGDKSLTTAPHCNNTLQGLDIGGNFGVTGAGLGRVAQVISALPALTRLDMSGSGRPPAHLPDTAAMALAEALPRLPALEDLVLQRISMEPAGFQAVVQAAAEHPTLELLV